MRDESPTEAEVRKAIKTAKKAQRKLSQALDVMDAWSAAHDGEPVPDEWAG